MKKTTKTQQLDRRSFLQVTTLAGGGVIQLSVVVPVAGAEATLARFSLGFGGQW